MTGNREIVGLLKKVPGCKEITDDDAGEWMGQNENCGILEDIEVVALVKENK